jgi:hypothetical protein
MAWTIELSDDDAIINVVTSGIMTKGHIIQMCSEAIAFGKEHRATQFLIDHRNMIPDSTVSSMDIYRLPLLLTDPKEGQGNRVAVMISSEKKEENAFRFFERVYRSNGHPFKVFREEPQALAWLSNE